MKTSHLNTMKSQLPLGACLLVTLVTATVVQKSSEAQAVNSIWERLKIADSRVNASQTTWSKRTTVAPSPLSEEDVQRIAAATREQNKKQNLPEADLEAFVKRVVAGTQRNAKGHSRTNTIAFLHQDQTTRCDVLTETKAYFAIDYYDGTNIVSLIGFDKDPNSGAKPNLGTLVRGNEPLPYSATRPGDLIFMVGQPVTEMFRPEDSKLQQNGDGSVTLEKSQKWQDIDCLLRLHLSKEKLRPTSLECIIANTSTLLIRWSAGREKSYPGGVSYPETFKIEAFDGAQKVTLSEDYKLLKGAFNKSADLTELRVPPGSIIDDLRFGQENVASYTLNTKGILPTDEKVKDLLLKQGRPVNGMGAEADVAPTNTDSPQPAPKSLATNTYSAAPLALGCLLILGGCLLWRNPNSDKENKVK